MGKNTSNTISEVTRRNIIDAITVANIHWSGRMSEPDFLSRLYDLSQLPSNDYRFSNAHDDIWKHREMNNDWGDDWVFHDPRFRLFHGPDDQFLRFLCEMVHPAVRPKAEEVQEIVETLNGYLAVDGWEMTPCGEVSGRPVFAANRLLEGAGPAMEQAKEIADALNAGYISQQITRMQAAIQSDPELAIGTAKEFAETICKTILRRLKVTIGKEDLPQLVKLATKALRLTPDDVPDAGRASEIMRVMLSNLANILKGLGELRNIHGSGHGKDDSFAQLGTRHARLAVGAATTLSVFLFETYGDSA